MSVPHSSNYAIFAALAICAVICYHGILDNGFHYDDEHSIVNNPHIRSLSNIPRFFSDPTTFSVNPEWRMYRPLLVTTYAINYWFADPEAESISRRIVGPHVVEGATDLSAAGFHVINIAVHVTNAWLVWALCVRLGAHWRNALLAAVLFTVHPLMTEPVNYVSSRSSLLCALFVLGALHSLIVATSKGVTPSWRTHVGISLLFAAAMGSKSIAIAFPPIAFLYLWVTDSLRRSWSLLIGSALIAVAYLFGTRAIVDKAIVSAPVRTLESQWASQIKAVQLYVAKVLFPVNQSVEPQFGVAESFSDDVVLACSAVVISIIIVLWYYRNRSWTVMLSIAWAGVALAPSAVVPLNVLVNEHRLYLPIALLTVALCSLIKGRNVSVAFTACLLLLCALTVRRNAVWVDEENLWEDAVAKGPSMVRPHVNLGRAYLKQDRFEDTIVASRRALALNSVQPRAHYNIGTAYLHQKEWEKAIASYDRALALEPRLMEAHNNLGTTYKQLGQYSMAINSFRQALAIVETDEVVHNVGSAFLSAGLYDSAAVYFTRALTINPGRRISYEGLAKTYGKQDRIEAQLGILEQALDRWPGTGRLLLMAGDAYAAAGDDTQAAAAFRHAGNDEGTIALRIGTQAARRRDWSRARQQYTRALETGAEAASVQLALGKLLNQTGKPMEALEAFRAAALLDSTAAEPLVGIGQVYLQHRSYAQATAALERAVELDVDDPEGWQLLAQSYSGAGNHELAASTLRRAIELSPSEAEQYHNLGILYQQLKAWTEAERAYLQALQRNAELLQAHFNLGFVYLQEKRFSAAVSACQRVLELDPDNAGGYVNMASAFRGLGNWSEAEKAYRQALALAGDREVQWREDVMRKLAELEALGPSDALQKVGH